MTASAPGKVFVAGEYGVLAGGPAVVAAVARRLACRVRLRPGRGRVEVRHGAHRGEAGLDGGVADLSPEVRFAAVAALAALHHLGRADCDASVETSSALDRADRKRGLGGSAAVTAATIAALYRASGRRGDERDLLERAALGVEAHRLAQGGGSGADVVAATAGGLVLVADLETGPPPSDVRSCRGRLRLSVERLELPAPLALEVVATERPAASGPRARRFVDALEGGGARAAALRAWCGEMAEAVDAFGRGCRAGRADAVKAAAERAGILLERLDEVLGVAASELRIATPELHAAVAAARAQGAAAKPSGAGGGDCAIALVDGARRDALRGAWRASGLVPLEVGIDLAGARVEGQETGREVHGGAR